MAENLISDDLVQIIPKSMDYIDFGGVILWIQGSIIILSYLLGCLNTGYYYVRFFYKRDIRTVGTNVTGAYNVSRIAGNKGFIITFIGDALKGALVIFLCRYFHMNDIITMLSILMVITGHIFPFQLKFQGGKGLSTAFGAFLAFHPMWMVFWIITCLLLLPLLRRYTVTSLFALILLPFELFVWDYPWQMIFFVFLYALVIVFACRDNLREYLNTRAYHGWHKDRPKN